MFFDFSFVGTNQASDGKVFLRALTKVVLPFSYFSPLIHLLYYIIITSSN
jgi:hypothetical protein